MSEKSPYHKSEISPGGFEVLVARDAASSEFLTFDIAEPGDLFFHVANTPGAHVILKVPEKGAKIPKEDLEFAARLAALNSKQKKASRVPVHYTEVRNVKRAPGPYKGTVRVSRIKKLVVRMLPE